MIKKVILLVCLFTISLATQTSYASSEAYSISIDIDDFKSFAENLYEALDDEDLEYDPFEKALKELDQTEDKIYSTINKHKYYGNKLKDRFHWLLRKEKNANIICIYLSPKILEARSKEYYSIIKILGDNIKEHLL